MRPLSRRAVALMLLLLALHLGLGVAGAAPSSDKRVVQVRDITDIEGIRDNQLVGYGLVVGLRGTGDRQQTFFYRADAGECHDADGRADPHRDSGGEERGCGFLSLRPCPPSRVRE